jgi:cytochrome c-type biogenesis protein CcmH/NrfG
MPFKQRNYSHDPAAARHPEEVQLPVESSQDTAASDSSSESSAKRENPLWVVNGVLAAFIFFAVMYLASR